MQCYMVNKQLILIDFIFITFFFFSFFFYSRTIWSWWEYINRSYPLRLGILIPVMHNLLWDLHNEYASGCPKHHPIKKYLKNSHFSTSELASFFFFLHNVFVLQLKYNLVLDFELNNNCYAGAVDKTAVRLVGSCTAM